MGVAHDGNIYSEGTQPNRVYKIFLARLGEPVTPREIFVAMDSTAPHTLVSTVRRQLPSGMTIEKVRIVDQGKEVGAWRLMKMEESGQLELGAVLGAAR